MVFGADAFEISRIEQEAFAVPWCMNGHISYTTDPLSRAWVAINNDGEIVGFIYCWFDRNCIVIERLAVDAKYQQCGIGRQMVSSVTSKLRPAGHGRRHFVAASVPDANLNAHIFFHHVGFEAVEVIKDYFGKNEDGYLFEFHHQQKELPCSSLAET